MNTGIFRHIIHGFLPFHEEHRAFLGDDHFIETGGASGQFQGAKVGVAFHCHRLLKQLITNSRNLKEHLSIRYCLQFKDALIVRSRTAHKGRVDYTEQAHVHEGHALVIGFIDNFTGDNALGVHHG